MQNINKSSEFDQINIKYSLEIMRKANKQWFDTQEKKINESKVHPCLTDGILQIVPATSEPLRMEISAAEYIVCSQRLKIAG
jgi:hypothetical protein